MYLCSSTGEQFKQGKYHEIIVEADTHVCMCVGHGRLAK